MYPVDYLEPRMMGFTRADRLPLHQAYAFGPIIFHPGDLGYLGMEIVLCVVGGQ